MTRIIITISLLVLCSMEVAMAQSSNLNDQQKEVMAVIEELFDGYRAGDSSMVAATFTKNAQMQRVQVKDGQSLVTNSDSVEGWLNYIGSGLEKLHDEPIWDYKVNIDGGLASVWTKYAFYLEGTFHHCGVDNFLLVNSIDGWKIFHIVDTSQVEGCVIPDAVRKKSEKN